MITFWVYQRRFLFRAKQDELVYGTYYLVSELLVFVVLLMLVCFLLLYGCIVVLGSCT